MPRIQQARVKSFLGEVYFVPIETDDEALAALLLSFGLGDGSSHVSVSSGIGDGDGDEDDAGQISRSTLLHTGLAGPTVRALVTNAYTGPVISDAGIFPKPTVRALVTTSTTRSLVGHPIMIYSIPQIVQVTYPASLAYGGHFLDNYPLNRTDFRMVRGIQNEIRFYVRDVDRRAVPLGFSETLTINIVDLATNTLLMTRNLTTIDNTQGIYLLTVLPAEMDTWPTTAARWSLSYNRSDGTTVLMWTDRAYSPYSTCTITEAPIPGPAVAVATQPGVLTNFSGVFYSPAFVGAFTHGYLLGAHTFVISMTNFTGSIRIDVSQATAPVNDNVSTDWTAFDSQSYVARSGEVVLTEVGNFLWTRVVVTPTSGTVDQIKFKN
jgi:hypothetical protein